MIQAFRPFTNSSFSFYFAGRVTSHVGVWFGSLALSLVVLQATGSAQAFSGVTIAQFIPMTLLSIPAGRLADRVQPRTILLVCAALAAILTTALAYVVAAPTPNIILIYILAALNGCITTFERVAEQTIIHQLVRVDQLPQGIALSSIASSSARSIGPGIAGLAFQGFGPFACMLMNSAAHVTAFISLWRVHPNGRSSRTTHAAVNTQQTPAALHVGKPPARPLLSIPGLARVLTINGLVSLFALNFMIVLTSVASLTFHASPVLVGVVHSSNAIGAIIGSLLVATRRNITLASLAPATALFGLALMLNAFAPNFVVFVCAGILLGAGFAYYSGVTITILQTSVPANIIGRVMSLFNIGHLGMYPLGAWISGIVIDSFNGQTMIALGSAVTLACSAVAGILQSRKRTPKSGR